MRDQTRRRVNCTALVVAVSVGASIVATAAQGRGAAPVATAGQAGSVTLVSAARLKPFLPELPGWVKGTVREETDTSEKVSRVAGRLREGRQRSQHRDHGLDEESVRHGANDGPDQSQSD
jgi:hypothetical protein